MDGQGDAEVLRNPMTGILSCCASSAGYLQSCHGSSLRGGAAVRPGRSKVSRRAGRPGRGAEPELDNLCQPRRRFPHRRTARSRRSIDVSVWIGLRRVMVAVLGERDPRVVPDRAGAGNGRRPGPAVPASAQPWCQARSRPATMSGAPDPHEVAVLPGGKRLVRPGGREPRRPCPVPPC